MPLSDSTTRRAAALRALGASASAVDELLAYGDSPLASAPLPALPLADEPCAAAWGQYAVEATAGGPPAGGTLGEGAPAVLRRHLVQLRFPVTEGISGTASYLAATRRGEWGAAPAPDRWPAFVDGAGVRVFVHDTAAGPLAVVVARARADFELLVRALTRRNEPAPVPAATGACMVAGLNNWSRVADARRLWAAARGADSDAAWRPAFAALVPQHERYQDRVVLLSDGPYSAVPAGEIGLSHGAWLATSRTIRLEHECAHYVTKRLFGSMRNALHDELLADRAGVVAACGAYRLDWARRFLGLEPASNGGVRVRPEGRLRAYRGTPALSDAAFAVLADVAWRATAAIDAFERGRPRSTDVRRDALEVLVALARTPAELLAADDAVTRLHAAHLAARAELRAAEVAGADAAISAAFGTCSTPESRPLGFPARGLAPRHPAAPAATPSHPPFAGAQP